MIQTKFFVEKTNLNNLQDAINLFLKENVEKIDFLDLKFDRPQASPAIAIVVYKDK